jgi:hypothetical protein
LLRAGDLVELRSPAEILETLDADGCLKGLPFMPEMLAYYGRTWRVTARLERACDTHTWSGTRRLADTVVLDDLRCDGSAHEGCDARCRIFWRETWLRSASGNAGQPSYETVAADPAFVELDRVARAATVRSEEPEQIFRCQATELLKASTPVAWWSPISLLREVSCGNVGLRRFIRVMAQAVADQFATRVLRRPVVPSAPQREAAASPPPALQTGQCVRVRPREEIARTLNEEYKNRGLRFDFPTMTPYCGKTAPVLLRVKRFIDEPSGKMIVLASDAYILDGVACSGDHSTKRWFCPRAIYSWWRGCWLEPLSGDGGRTSQPNGRRDGAA